MGKSELLKCNLCPRKCNVTRVDGNVGFCKAPDSIVIAHVSKHMWEEPCISGKNGSGTIFFSGCNLKCKFCQNYKISQDIKGKEYNIKELAKLFLELEKQNVNNINLVTPTIYIDKIKEAIIIAKQDGLKIPIIYNTSGYENLEIIKSLDGLIDVYLPDFKYFSNSLAFKYSLANNYVENAKKCLLEMKKQVGNPSFDGKGLIKKGLIIRHLILPNNILNSKMVIKWIKENLGDDTYISLMAQYFPTPNIAKLNESRINRKITKEELDEIYNYMLDIGIKNGYVQSIEDCEEKYVPDFK